MEWVATLSAECDERGDFDHAVEIEATDWVEAAWAALRLAAPDWIVMDVSGVMSADERRFG